MEEGGGKGGGWGGRGKGSADVLLCAFNASAEQEMGKHKETMWGEEGAGVGGRWEDGGGGKGGD